MAVEELVGHIPDGWTYTTLGKACADGGGDIQTGPFGSQLHAADYVPVGVPSIMPQNIGDNRISEYGIARITPEDATRLSRYLVREGDIVYSRRGDVEKRALIRANEDGWLCGTGCLRVRLGDNGANPSYAAYYLGHPSVREWIVRHAHGATMPNLNTSILSSCPFVIPPPAEQRAIAHILGTLDDKIELNRRRNQTLEAMARALFKDWFVDFGPVRAKMEGRHPYLPADLWQLFPDRLDDEGKPEGWSERPLGDFVHIYDSRRVPLSGKQRRERQGPYPYHGAAGLMDSVDDFLFDGVHVLLGEDGSVVKPNGRPYTQYVWGKFWVNNHAHVLRGRGISNETLLLFLDQCDVAPFVTGAVQPKLSQGNLKAIPFINAGDALLRRFGEIVDPLFAQIRCVTEESRTLAQLRDTLLPKLISGELRIADAEKFLEGVGP